ncbi:MAG: TIGR02677 family protein [Acidimicrobiales bacterium]
MSVLRLATADSASAYLAVAGALAAARERYEVQVRTEAVADAVAPLGVAAEDVAGLLRQLYDWKVVEASLDTSRATRIEDFRRRRELWRLTPGGQAAVDAVTAVLGAAEEQGALHRSLLGQVRVRLEDILADIEAGEPGRVTAALRSLDNDLRLLATGARDFHAALAALRAETEADPERFLAFKERLLAHLESFVDELTRHRSGIADAVARAEAAATSSGTTLARLAAEGDDAAEVDGPEATAARWQRRWDGLVGWFVGDLARPLATVANPGARAHGRPAGADDLKRATTQALRELVGLLRRLTEAEARPVTRASELRHLARWFLRLETEEEAHELFDAAIGLGRPTHLGVAPDDPEATPPGESWWTAPAVEVGVTLRRTGQRAAPGNLFPLTSTSAQRARLAEEHRRAAASRAAAAAALLARPLAGRRLSPPEGDLLLELLDRALHRRSANPDGEGAAGQADDLTTTSTAQGVRLLVRPWPDGFDVLLPGGRLHLEGATLHIEPAHEATLTTVAADP